jgi:hypothetical protein
MAMRAASRMRAPVLTFPKREGVFTSVNDFIVIKY